MQELQVLINAIELAQKRGAYSLQEVAQILPAISSLSQQAAAQQAAAQEAEEKATKSKK